MNSTLRLVLVVLFVLLLVGMLPTWPYSSGWGYFPSGGVALLLLLVVGLAVFSQDRKLRS